MKLYRITIPMTPQGKGRGRAVRMGGSIRVITPAKTRTYEATLADLSRATVGDLLLDGPLGLRIWAVFPRSKELSRVLKRTGHPKHPTCFLPAFRVRSDIDNICKAIMDGLNGVVWVDDRQIVKLEGTKVIAEMVKVADEWRCGVPRVEIQISHYEDSREAYEYPPLWVDRGRK